VLASFSASDNNSHKSLWHPGKAKKS